MAKIPDFKSLDEAVSFWDTHDFADYIDDTEPVKISVRLRPRRRILTIPVDLKTYERLEALAARRKVSTDKLVLKWVKEKVMAETTAH